jgi:nitric oxide reductase activation protein
LQICSWAQVSPTWILAQSQSYQNQWEIYHHTLLEIRFNLNFLDLLFVKYFFHGKQDEKSASRRSLSDNSKVKKLNSDNESDETDATISTDEEEEDPESKSPSSNQKSKLAKMFIK